MPLTVPLGFAPICAIYTNLNYIDLKNYSIKISKKEVILPRGGRGSLAHGRFIQVQSHVSVKRQAEARSVCMSRVQDRTCVGCNATATRVL